MSFPVDLEACRRRQQRLIRVMERLELDWVVLSSIENVQWLTGVRSAWTFAPLAAIHRLGEVTLVFPHRRPEEVAADEVETYEAKWHSTMRNDQREASTKKLLDMMRGRLSQAAVGLQFSSAGGYLFRACNGRKIDIDAEMYQLRRRKDTDELMRLRRAIDATEKMYEAARATIAPGVSEIDLFNELQSVAVTELGEMLTGTGNDYQVNSRGGPPRAGIAAEPGQLWILDLGPAYQGYFADNARTIAVTDVSKEQLMAYDHIMLVFDHVEKNARAGVSCRKLFEDAQEVLDTSPVGVFNHHLGHGIGLFPHEGPHLNPNWDDTLEVGDVFTAEPGLYAPELNAGMRIENDYLVTSTGVECLTPFSTRLKI